MNRPETQEGKLKVNLLQGRDLREHPGRRKLLGPRPQEHSKQQLNLWPPLHPLGRKQRLPKHQSGPSQLLKERPSLLNSQLPLKLL